jgi:vitamin B12 transporter
MLMIIRIFLLYIFFNFTYAVAKDIPIIVISAGKTPQSKSTVGSSVSIIDSKTIESSGEYFLGNILDNSVPGMNSFQSGGHGTTQGIQMRGLPKRYSTVYIDGVKMSDPSSNDNSFYMSNIMNSDIERVEILKGSQSSLYGSGAIGGTINIITKKGGKTPTKNINFSSGSNGTTNKNASFGGSKGNSTYYVGLTQFDTDGVSAMNDYEAGAEGANDDDAYTNESIITNYGYDLGDGLSFEGSARYSDSRLEYDRVNSGQTDLNDLTDDEELTYTLKLLKDFRQFKNSVNYNYTQIDRSAKAYTNALSHYWGYREALNYLGEYNFNLDQRIVYGADMEIDTAEQQTSTGNKDNREKVYSQYFDYQFRPMEKLYSTVGFRRDSHTVAGAYTTGRASLAYKLDNSSKIRTSYGTGIMFPTLYQYYVGTAVTDPETLTPEKSKSFDVGYEKVFESMNLTFDITAFKVTYEDALEGWRANTQDDGSGSYVVKNTTAGVESKGIELTTLWEPKSDFNLSLSYNYNESYDGADCEDPHKNLTWDNKPLRLCIDSQMIRVPRHEVTSGLGYKFNKDLSNKIFIKYSGERRDYGNTNNGFNDVILDDYITINYHLNYKLYNQYNLYLIANNVFDQKYEEAYQYTGMEQDVSFGIKRSF